MKKKPNKGLIIGAIVLLATLAIWMILRGGSRRKPAPERTTSPTPSMTVINPIESDGGAFIGGAVWESYPPVEPDFVDTSSNEDTSSLYQNDQVFSIIYNEAGDTISIGLGDATQTKAIYLNFSESSGERNIGYYVDSSRNPILHSPDMHWSDRFDEQNSECHNFLINRTYDQLVPAEGTTAWWVNDLLFDGKADAATELYVRAIDVDSGEMIATFRIEIANVLNTFRIAAVTSTDVRNTGKMDETDRTLLLENAIALARNDVLGLDSRVRTDMEGMEDADLLATGKVEYLGNRMYFNKSLSSSGKTVMSYRFQKLYQDIYAVTFSTNDGGAFTMYYSPDVGDELSTAIQESLTETYGDEIPEDVVIPPLDPVTTENLRFFGTDLYRPFSQSSFAPSGFFD